MVENELPELPDSVADIAEVLGRHEALRFIGNLPPAGRRSWRRCIYIPKRIPPGHWLIDALGVEGAARMSSEFAGMILQPSNCSFLYRDYRRCVVRELDAEGIPLEWIALHVGLSVSWIVHILAKK